MTAPAPDNPRPTPLSPPALGQPGEAVTGRRDNLTVEETLPAPEEGSESSLDLARIIWSITTLSFLIAMVILLLRGDLGYAGVTLAVALAAAINLF